jgi:hypothetical protein
MAFANPNISDIVATTIENRSKKLADNVSKNNALLAKLEQRGNTRTVSGGTVILEEITHAENANAGWYSGYDLLPVAAQDVISSAQYDLKQAACPVIWSGLDELRNNGKEQMIDLLEGRIKVAESTMMNLLAAAVYSDGTAAGGKQIVGLKAAVPVNGATGTYGGISRDTWAFWRPRTTTVGAALTPTTIQAAFNDMWAGLVRGSDRPDLIIVDNAMWGIYVASLQAQQRFTDPSVAKLGFPELAYMGASLILDGGIGGFADPKTAYFLNTKYLFWRPHSDRNMVPLNPSRRYAVNQDATVQILAFAGALTCSGQMFQGRLTSP